MALFYPSLTHGQRNEKLWGHISVCLWINLDVLYGFATENFIRKASLMVAGGEMPDNGGRFLESSASVVLVDLVFKLSFAGSNYV